MSWLFLAVAISTEVTATMSLQAAASPHSSRWWCAVVIAGYGITFTFLSLARGEGMPLGAAHGIWAAVGVALTAVLGHLIFKQPVTWMMALGIALIMGGVLLVETGAY